MSAINTPINAIYFTDFSFDADEFQNSLLNIDLIKLDINNLIINKKQLTEEYLKLPYNIIIKNEYDEIIQVINHDQT